MDLILDCVFFKCILVYIKRKAIAEFCFPIAQRLHMQISAWYVVDCQFASADRYTCATCKALAASSSEQLNFKKEVHTGDKNDQ